VNDYTSLENMEHSIGRTFLVHKHVERLLLLGRFAALYSHIYKFHYTVEYLISVVSKLVCAATGKLEVSIRTQQICCAFIFYCNSFKVQCFNVTTNSNVIC